MAMIRSGTGKMKKFLLTIVALMSMILVGCGKETQEAESDGLDIVTSFYPVYAMTKEVSGDLNNVRMIQSGGGIHGFEPSASDIRAIDDSDVFVYHADTLESWAGNLKDNLTDGDVTVIEGTDDLKLERTNGLEDFELKDGMDEDSLNDVHTWTDPVMVGEEAINIAKKLGEADPDNAETYMNNAKEMQKEGQAIIDEFKPKFADLKQDTFVTQHTAFAYLAKRLGIKQLGIAGQENSEEPSAQRISEIQKFVKKYHVKTIFTEGNVSPKYAQVISDETGVELDELSPLEVDPENDQSYLDNLRDNIDTLYQRMAEESKEMK